MATYKKMLTWLIKAVISGLLALIMLTGFCYFYYNIPVHYDCIDGATDHSWQPNVFYSRATEGIAWGRTNNEGYINAYNYTDGMPIDVLMVGSSHMEAFQVQQEESTAGILDKMLEQQTVYNIGMSKHGFLTCVCNLEAAICKYRPGSYVVIETGAIIFSENDLSDALNGERSEILSNAGGIVGFLQKNQYLRLLYSQIKNFGFKQNDEENEQSSITQDHQETNNEDLLDKLLQKVSSSAEEVGTNVIIMYHPDTAISESGQLLLPDDDLAVNQFRTLCEKNGILFLDMSERFAEEYQKNSILPYGFCNSSVGTGHLNKYGHAMIAEELYKLMEGQ